MDERRRESAAAEETSDGGERPFAPLALTAAQRAALASLIESHRPAAENSVHATCSRLPRLWSRYLLELCAQAEAECLPGADPDPLTFARKRQATLHALGCALGRWPNEQDAVSLLLVGGYLEHSLYRAILRDWQSLRTCPSGPPADPEPARMSEPQADSTESSADPTCPA